MPDRIPLSPPVIPALPPTVARPLWSVMIPVYNCAEFLPETLMSVLQQARAETSMQIEVIDDASTDADVKAIVQQVGQGRVKYYRQPENVGSLRNFETCLNRARGQLVHLLHGDDRVAAGYYDKISYLFEQFPEAGAAFCRFNYVDGKGEKIYDQRPEINIDGILPDWLLKIAEYQRMQYVAVTVRREVYEKLGGFYGVTYGEDWEMWVRIARSYPIAYTPEILADYRKHISSISGQKFLSGQHLHDLTRVMEYIQQYLPENQRQSIFKKSKKFYAAYGLRLANQLWHLNHDKASAHAQIKTSLSLSKALNLYPQVLKIYTKMLINRQ